MTWRRVSWDEQIRRQRGLVGKWLAGEPDGLERRRDHIRLDEHLIVLGAVRLSDSSGMRGLAECLLREVHRIGPDTTAGLGHVAHNQARINPARQERAERHVRNQTQLSRLAQELVELLQRIPDGYPLRLVAKSPICPYIALAAFIHEPFAWRSFAIPSKPLRGGGTYCSAR